MAGRRRPNIPPATRDQIPDLARQGWSQQRIAAHLGVSTGYVNKALRRAPPAAPPGVPVDAPEAPTVGEIPDDADIATLEALQRKYEAMSRRAETDGNLTVFVALQRLLRDVIDRKRKFRPPPVEKPEDKPDFVRAGDRVAEQFQELIKTALRKAEAGLL